MAASFGQLLFQQEVIGQHPPLGDRAFDHQQQMVGIDRLGQEVDGPLAHGGHRILDAAVGRHDDDLQFRIKLFRGAEHAEAVAVRKLQVGQHDSRTGLPQLLHGLGLVAGLNDGVPLRLERMPEHRPQRIFVFDEKDWERGHQWISGR